MQNLALMPAPAPQLRCLSMLDEAVARIRETPRKPQARRYSRREALARCGCFHWQDIDDTSQSGRRKVLIRLDRALKRELKNRDAGAWNYNRNRHADMLNTYKLELAAYEAITDTQWGAAA